VNTTYRLVRLLSLLKLGEIGPVKLYPERSLFQASKHNGPLLTLDYIIYNLLSLKKLMKSNQSLQGKVMNCAQALSYCG
jgi:hypothetical protein